MENVMISDGTLDLCYIVYCALNNEKLDVKRLKNPNPGIFFSWQSVTL